MHCVLHNARTSAVSHFGATVLFTYDLPPPSLAVTLAQPGYSSGASVDPEDPILFQWTREFPPFATFPTEVGTTFYIRTGSLFFCTMALDRVPGHANLNIGGYVHLNPCSALFPASQRVRNCKL